MVVGVGLEHDEEGFPFDLGLHGDCGEPGGYESILGMVVLGLDG